MSKIKILSPQIAQSIAAGEVVERPASVVKELLENAMDAGADRVQVLIEQGGIKSIIVRDNGSGINHEELALAFADHATSKIEILSDLDSIRSFGFRGEALPTIAAVSKVKMTSKTKESEHGSEILIHGGEIIHHKLTAANPGSIVEVRELFYNTPARFKFLKQDKTEAAKITEVVQEMALSRPDVSFYLENQGKEVLHTPGDNRLISTIYAVFGQEMAKQLIPIIASEIGSAVVAKGYISRPEFSRKSRTWQIFFVNGRPIHSPLLMRAVEDAYKSTVMVGKFPACILQIELPGNLVDVNVHPRKLEVRFWNESEVYKQVYHQVQNSLFTALRPSQINETSDTEESLNIEINTSAVEAKEAEPVAQAQINAEPRLHNNSPNYLQFDFDGYSSVKDKPQEAYSISSMHTDNDVSLGAPLDNQKTAHQENFSNSDTSAAHKDSRLLGLENGRYVGELFRTYLIFEYKTFFYILDQHAAHEKILFEKAVQSYHENHQLLSQNLLEAEEMEIMPSDSFILEEHEQFIKQYGFDFSFIGTKSILIRAIPVGQEVIDPKRALRYLLDEIKEHGVEGVKGESDLIYNFLATSSCKAAVKAHDKLHENEVTALVKDLLRLQNPYHCPHGRPIIIEIEEKQLEKLFKRIV